MNDTCFPIKNILPARNDLHFDMSGISKYVIVVNLLPNTNKIDTTICY